MNYISVQKIAQVRLLCRKVLPAVYDESLSYLEGICKLTYKVNETIDSVNALNDNVGVLNDSVTELNARVEAVENEISGFEQQITEQFNQLSINLNAEVDAKLAENTAKVDAKLAEVDGKFNSLEQQIIAFENSIREQLGSLERDLRALLNAEIEHINEMYDTFEEEMRQYTYEEIQKALKDIPDLTNIYVIDPTTGKLSKVQVAINNIFTFSAYNAFTVDEFNALEMTIDVLNSIMVKSIPRGLTIYEWMHDAKRILLTQIAPSKAKTFAYPHTFMRDYLDGRDVWHDRNVDINQQLIASSGCYSCDELVTMAFTVNEIIGFNISCYQFIMRANSLMVRSA